MKNLAHSILDKKWFEPFIMAVILINCTLIGVETYVQPEWIIWVQQIALIIFAIEIWLRWVARDSVKSFFRDGWNCFDLAIVLVSLIPESLFEDTSLIMSIRILRVFRVLRLLRAANEVKLIVSVLIKSFSALTFNGIFFFIFMYLFSLIGLNLFKLPTHDIADAETLDVLTEYAVLAPHAPANSPDPYGTLSESMFTLFRILTGEDWTDLRYNLCVASDLELISASPSVITTFHVLWFVLSAFLLLNLLVGAILNNYQVIMEESKNSKDN
ncbi:MAG: ion transporter [Bacteroidetes bacterium]|nr:ion transporter [Bacteroidota bacterium]MDA1336643.1 ion transporter [Bacteroidota bacterium]